MRKAVVVLSNDHGIVTFSQCCEKHVTIVTFHLKNFEPRQTHAIHIHEFGDTRDGCKSLGLHYNPFGSTHGCKALGDNMHHRHAGDLINNFTTDDHGKFDYRYEDTLITLHEEDSIYGRSIVIHRGIDDLGRGTGSKENESLISGNAGERISCGVIGRSS